MTFERTAPSRSMPFVLTAARASGNCTRPGPRNRLWPGTAGRIVSRTESALQKSAVGGDQRRFLRHKPGPYQGDPRGIQIANGELVSRPTGNAFWVDTDGHFNIGPVESKLRVVWPDGSESAFGLNEARADDAVVLYTPTLGIRANEPPPGTRTQGGKELVLSS